MNRRLLAYITFIAAIFIVGPYVSFAAGWSVKALGPGEKSAPTRIVTGGDPATWPADYVPAKVGEACDCSKSYAGERELAPGMPEALAPDTWCVLKARRQIAAVCEVAK